MVCACRVSKKVLNLVKKYTIKHKKLLFIELLFNTLSYQNDLTIDNPDELSTIICKYNWKLEDINKDNLYHPIKDYKVQEHYRSHINS